VEMTTRADAARFVGLLRSWRQTSPHWDYAAELLLESGGDQKADRHRSGHDPVNAPYDATMAMKCRRRPEPTVHFWQCAPKARITCGGRIHPETCRLVW
jgi:hypothetical protein